MSTHEHTSDLYGRPDQDRKRQTGSETPKTRYFRAAKSLPEVARVLGVSPDTIRRCIARGELRAVLVTPRCYRVMPNDLNAFLTARIVGPKAGPGAPPP